MAQYILVFVAAIAIAAFSMPLVRRAATRFGVVAVPSARGIHANPVPLLGGLAIWLGFVVTLLVFERGTMVEIASILLGGTLLTLVGLWDDRWNMKPLVKLAAQAMAAGLLIVIGGVQINVLRNDALNILATLLWIVGITNALNLMDNMDGLAGGVAAWAAAFFFIIAVLTGQYYVAPLAAALTGACIGFLYYNLRPATHFMGDTGSLFLGFVLATVAIKLRFPEPYNTDAVTWMIPLLVLGVPLFDTTLVTISRLRRGIPITRGGRDHVSHRLVAIGYTRREAVLILYLASAVLGIAALIVMQAHPLEAYLVGALVVGAAGGLFWRLEQVPLIDTNPK
jgi:UDP-GlcNAc:undecaprenyl-phosphate/decaprenyl-phosphate GlcNAc-1-phosphate transferase